MKGMLPIFSTYQVILMPGIYGCLVDISGNSLNMIGQKEKNPLAQSTEKKKNFLS
jgi:hypothetical protein